MMNALLSLLIVGILAFGATPAVSQSSAAPTAPDAPAAPTAPTPSVRSNTQDELNLQKDTTVETNEAVEKKTPTTFKCKIDGCLNTEKHSHDYCTQGNCTKTGAHQHSGDWYHGHHDGDGHNHSQQHNKATNCTVSGCTKTGKHTHKNSKSTKTTKPSRKKDGSGSSASGSGHHGERKQDRDRIHH